jgi:NAD(P)-dependent dehydrogenase (short-subunit alcohol dehydrogenase family)
MPTTPKIALITGGSRGLGRNTALHLARRGVDVMVTYQTSEPAAQALVEECLALGRQAVALHYDANHIAGIDEFVAAVQRALATIWNTDQFDFLVNNAGAHAPAPFDEITEADFDRLSNIHFKSVLFLSQKLLPLLNDGGRIVNVSTSMTRHANAGSAAYAAMKGALEVLTRFMAVELGPRGICVNAVAPGPVATDFFGGAVRDIPQVQEFVTANTALGRTGVPDDIGPFIASLLSDDSRWLNGQRLELSGGIFL